MISEERTTEENNRIFVRAYSDDKAFLFGNDDVRLYLMLRHGHAISNQQELFHLIRLEVEDAFTKAAKKQ